jgi:predicted nucleotidyltransferase
MRYKEIIENMDHGKDGGAVEELRAALIAHKDKLQDATDDQVYNIIDKMMTRIAKTHSMSGQKLHDMWVSKYKQVPDTWIIKEAFDQPYSFEWEEGEDGEAVDALATLSDGTYLSIMFSKEFGDSGDDLGDWAIEFHRNNSQEVTGEGDAQRVFATVLEAIRQFVKKYKANTITFSAMKELDPTTYYGPDDVVPNPESRAKLYNRLVQRYAGAMGYSATQREGNGKVTYTLKRTKPGVAEGLGQDYLSQVPNLTWKPVSRSVWNTIQDEGLDEEQDAPKHTDWIMASLTISPEDARALQAFDSDAIEDFNRFDIHLKSRHPGLTDLIDYDNGTVTIVKPSQKQGVAEGKQPGQPVVDAILKVMPVAQEIWFHGSRATGKHRKNSDTDILVVVPDDLVGDQYLGVVRILQKLSSHFDNYDIQPTKAGTNIHRIAQEEGRLLWSNKQDMAENFADGRNPQDKGDSKRHGVPTKASISTLRKVAKQGGRKGQLAHWMANMKSGRAKAKK